MEAHSEIECLKDNIRPWGTGIYTISANGHSIVKYDLAISTKNTKQYSFLPLYATAFLPFQPSYVASQLVFIVKHVKVVISVLLWTI